MWKEKKKMEACKGTFPRTVTLPYKNKTRKIKKKTRVGFNQKI